MAFWISAALSVAGCESTDKPPAATGNIVLTDANNYQSTSDLNLPVVETAPQADLDICWANLVTDIQCHPVAPQADLDNVGFLRFRNLTQRQVEMKLTAGELNMSEIDGYVDRQTDHVSTCAKLSQFNFLGTPTRVVEEYVESAERVYMLVFTKGTTPGVGARAMTFVKPTAGSNNTRVDAPAGCGLLTFSADLSSLTKLPVSLTGPWVVDWRNITRDGQGNAVSFESIDSVLIGFYEGMTVAALQDRILDLELIATSLWELPVSGGRTANLAQAKRRGTGAAFPGFASATGGVWVLGLMCSGCQNPAPVLLTVLQPGADGG